MPAALQVFDAAGNVIVDTSRRLGIFLGAVDTGTADGSLAVPDFNKGTPFFFAQPLQAVGNMSLLPGVGLSGSSLVWSFVGGVSGSQRLSVRIFYGVY